MLVVLIGLGIWQLQRREWKHALLAQIDAAESHPAVPLPADPPQFAKVRAEGTLRNDLGALYGAEGRDLKQGPTMGAGLITPLERPGADPILVLRGWVPALPAPAAPQPAAIDGYVRQPEPAHWFTPAPDLAGKHFYALDPAVIGAALGLPKVAPFVLVALGPADGSIPDPAHSLPRPPDDHLQYAFTWFGLAATLLVIFALYARKVLRS